MNIVINQKDIVKHSLSSLNGQLTYPCIVTTILIKSNKYINHILKMMRLKEDLTVLLGENGKKTGKIIDFKENTKELKLVIMNT